MSLWDYWISWGLPFMLVFPLTLLFSFEILYYLKEKKNGKFHAARMAKQASLILISVVVITVTAFVSSYYFAPRIGLSYAAWVGLFLTLLILVIIAYVTRRLFRRF